MTEFNRSSLARWRADPSAFVEEVLVNPETGAPFELLPAECEFLRFAFMTGDDGRLLFPELLYAAIKKSGKTGFAAMVTIYVVLVLGVPFAEGYVLANDLEQSQARVFTAIKRIIAASPLLKQCAVVTASKIEFPDTNGTITALASDAASAAGAAPNISVFDELWGFVSERSRRLWDEMVPVPTKRISCRLVVTHAGFERVRVASRSIRARHATAVSWFRFARG